MCICFNKTGLHLIIAVEEHQPLACGIVQPTGARRPSGVVRFLSYNDLEIGRIMLLSELFQHLHRVIGAGIVNKH